MKENYYAEQIEIERPDLKKNWKAIKEIIGKHNHSRGNRRTEYNINAVLTYDSHIRSNEFNNYFTNIGPELAKYITIVSNTLYYVTISLKILFLSIMSQKMK